MNCRHYQNFIRTIARRLIFLQLKHGSQRTRNQRIMICVAFRCTGVIETFTQIKPAVKGCASILTTNGVIEITYIKLKKKPQFYLPREFTNVNVATIYTPLNSNLENANNIINKHVNDLMTKLPDCINIHTGYFNSSRGINILGLLQYVNCLTRGHARFFFLQCQGRLYLCPTGAHRQV